MKKTVLIEWERIVIEEEAIPAIGEEQVLIKLLYAGICGTDMHVFSHSHASATIPRVLGHEYCGEIVAVNSAQFSALQPGDYVTSHPLQACGHCKSCLTGNENVCESLKIYGIHTDGCFAQYFVVPAARVYPISPEVDPVIGAQIEPLAVALHDVRLSGLKAEDSVLVISAGPIGMLIAMVARRFGARKVVLSEVNPFRRAFAENLGFTVLNPVEEDFAERLRGEEQSGFDIVFEASGSRAGAALMTEATALRAMVVIVGVPRESYPVDTGAFLAKELRSVGVRIHPQYHFKEAVDLVNAGVFHAELKKFVTHIFPLCELRDAILFNAQDEAHLKILLKA